MAYTVNGNLFLQDGNHQAVQLTESGEDYFAIFSDDGEKIVFCRGDFFCHGSVYSVNADGSREQALITTDWLTSLGRGTITGSRAFVPGTHKLLFNTYLCPNEPEGGSCTTGIFLVDTDTGKIQEFLAPRMVGDLVPHDTFKVSPDGKMVSVAQSGHIDVFNMDGKLIYRNIMTYIRSTPAELVPMQYWLSDSSGLIIILPTKTKFGSAFPNPTYAIRRYLMGGRAVQIPLDNQQPMMMSVGCGDQAPISPDGNWILYFHEPLLYLGNLRDGHAKTYASGCPCPFWSPDSKHFIYVNENREFFLGAINASPIPLSKGTFLEWYDTTHYIYAVSSSSTNGEENIRIFVGEIDKGIILTYESGIIFHKGYSPWDFINLVQGRSN